MFAKKRAWLLGIGLLILAVIAYYPVLFAEYVTWDDNLLVVENHILNLPFLEAFKIVFSTYFNGDSIPLAILSFWIEKNLFGFGAQGQHGTNLVLHGFNVFLLWRVLKPFSIPKSLILLILFTFAIHPLQAESVAWISERKGLGATLFALLSTLAKHEKRVDRKFYMALP